jgi:hypothetical protein
MDASQVRSGKPHFFWTTSTREPQRPSLFRLMVLRVVMRFKRPKNDGVVEDRPVTSVTPAEAVSLACCSRGRYGKCAPPAPELPKRAGPHP